MPHDANFCADGLVWPDRTPHPALHELKFLSQPVRVEAVNAARGRFRVSNRLDFTNLDGLRGSWELTRRREDPAEGEAPAAPRSAGRQSRLSPSISAVPTSRPGQNGL